MEIEALIDDPLFANGEMRSKHRADLNARIEAVTRTKSSAEWIEALNAAEVPCGPIYAMDQVFADPQVQHLQMAPTVRHPQLGEVALVGQAIKLSRTPAELKTATPGFGEHTDAVLAELGYSQPIRLPRCTPRELFEMPDTQQPAEDLLYDVQDGIARVTFDRPQARNAMLFSMYERLAAICAEIDADKSIRALVLTGAGEKAFAAGTDISQFRAFKTPEDALEYEARVDRVLGALERVRVPTIAAIAGACTGGGAGMAACCDLRIAASNVRFGFPIARTLGNCLSMNNYARLVALIGAARVKDMVFTARLVEAEEAKSIGLINEILPDPAALATRANELARLVAANAPLTLRATKEALRRIKEQSVDGQDKDLILLCYMSADFREGMDAFLNKRPPVWKGE